MKPVAITGIGAISPYGYGRDALIRGIAAGPVTFCPLPEREYRHGPGWYGPVPFDTLPSGTPVVERANNFCKLGYWAAHQALRDAKYKVGTGYDTALISASTLGYSVVEQYGDMLDMRRAQYLYHSSINGVIAMTERVRGMQFILVSEETAATKALGLAAQLIANGRCKAVLTGGVEIYSRTLCLCYSTVNKVSPKDKSATATDAISIQPWHPQRNGFIFSEGACYFMLEDLELAQQRNATIYALITGWGAAQEPVGDGYTIDTQGGGLTRAIDQAITSANTDSAAIDTVIASANGAVVKDAVELSILTEIFNPERTNPVNVISFKSRLGETLGAGGAFSTALAATLPELVEGNHAVTSLGFDKLSPRINLFSGNGPVGKRILITDLGYHGDSAALIIERQLKPPICHTANSP